MPIPDAQQIGQDAISSTAENVRLHDLRLDAPSGDGGKERIEDWRCCRVDRMVRSQVGLQAVVAVAAAASIVD